MLLWPQDGGNYMMWHIHLDPPHTAAHWWSCPPSLPFPFKTRLEVPLCFCITLQTSHPYSHSPRCHVASAPHTLVTQPSTCVPCPHLSPPSQVCLCAASLTPAPSMPRPQLIPHPGPLPCPVSTRIQVLPISQGCLQMPILVLHQAIYHDYILYCSWPWVLPCPFGSELLDCGATFSTSPLSPMPQTKTPSSMLRGYSESRSMHWLDHVTPWPLPCGLSPQSQPRPRPN